jgi:hypothetical protein
LIEKRDIREDLKNRLPLKVAAEHKNHLPERIVVLKAPVLSNFGCQLHRMSLCPG